MSLKKLTFVDTGVLIIAVTGKDRDLRLQALKLLGDRRREFASSTLLRLELIPAPYRNKYQDQVRFYESFFKRVKVWVDPADFIDLAFDLSCRYPLGLMDALHVAAASTVNAEFISTEKPTKPIYQAYKNAVTLN